MSSAVTLTKDNFDETIAAEKPVLVDFWAEWCGPCKAIAPILDEIAVEHADKITIAKLNVDDEKELAERFEVRGIPLMILFQEGEILAKLVGSRPKQDLLDSLLPLL
jgi:thioredoxin 1